MGSDECSGRFPELSAGLPGCPPAAVRSRPVPGRFGVSDLAALAAAALSAAARVGCKINGAVGLGLGGSGHKQGERKGGWLGSPEP